MGKRLKSSLLEFQKRQQTKTKAQETANKQSNAKPVKKNKKDLKMTDERAIAQLKKEIKIGPSSRILLVGEANFSFTQALLRLMTSGIKAYDTRRKRKRGIDGSDIDSDVEYNDQSDDLQLDIDTYEKFGLIVATTLDSEEITREKYPDLSSIMSFIEERSEQVDCSVMFGVDATDAQKLKSLIPKTQRFDKIIFNFPHVSCGISNQKQNILANQRLVFAFLKTCAKYLVEGGQLVISLKEGPPYDSWCMKQLLKVNDKITVSDRQLVYSGCQKFNIEAWEQLGYAHRRTIGFTQGVSGAQNEDIKKSGAKHYIYQLNTIEL
ncbi:hypothetical protein MP228_001812 [Amoeboaphelidium protococcarum]|nr:hypothetical protein MP228_001812 [Amoeboaphelidium protococcarum]